MMSAQRPRCWIALASLLLGSGTAAANTAPDDRESFDLATRAEHLAQRTLAGLSLSGDPCETTARIVARAAILRLQSDLASRVAFCLNSSDSAAQRDCLQEAWQTFEQGVVEARRQHEARLDVCSLLEERIYDPLIRPTDFVARVDHPLFPLTPGTRWLYRRNGEKGIASEVTVLPGTIRVQGVECTVVRDRDIRGGQIVEETLDYFAQDFQGNVWYFGELAMHLEDGRIANLNGSWTAGEAGAKAGMILQATPQVGSSYRREFCLLAAEDMTTVLGRNACAVVPQGTFDQCIEIIDFSPLEQEAEYKYYCPGYGIVLEVDVATGDRIELVRMEQQGSLER